VSKLLYNITNRWTVLVAVLAFGFFVLWVMPNSPHAGRIVSGDESSGIPGVKLFTYTADDFYRQLDDFGPEGRQAFVDYRGLTDTLWLLSLAAFFTLSTGALLKGATTSLDWRRKLNTLGLFPAALDFAENQLQIWLIAGLPERFDSLATLAGALTGLKWLTLMLALAALLYAVGLKVFAGRR